VIDRHTLIVMECPLTNRFCRLLTRHGGFLYCGQAVGENRIALMKKCPLPKKRKNISRSRRRYRSGRKHISLCMGNNTSDIKKFDPQDLPESKQVLRKLLMTLVAFGWDVQFFDKDQK
jgi:hypothetical protein